MFNWLEWNTASVGNIIALVRPHLSTMQSIATDGLADWRGLSLCLSLYHNCGPCRNAWTDRDAIQDIDSDGPRNHMLDGRPDPHTQRGNFEGENGPVHHMPGHMLKVT